MLRLGVLERDQLLVHVHRFTGARWVRSLRAVAPLADGRSESPGESVLRLRLVERRIPVEPRPADVNWRRLAEELAPGRR